MEHTDPVTLTDEEANRSYLEANPAYECQLWQEWVLVVCKRRSIAPPTGKEWNVLSANWTSGKAPLDSVDELEKLRIGV